MYSHFPPRLRSSIRVALTIAWAFSALAGAVGVFSNITTDPVIVGQLRDIGGGILAATATFAAVGVALNRYRLEWVASWFSAAALTPYTMVYWYTVFAVDGDRAESAFLLTSLIVFYLSRAIMCAAHAQRLRALHEEEIPNV
jgi:hypothetical protein